MSLIGLLKSTQEQTLKYYDLSEADLSKKYAPGKWSVRQILSHLADTEMVLLTRLKKIISEPRQVIWAFDQDLWCSTLDYNTFPLALSKNSFIAGRQEVIYLVGKFYGGSDNREFIHSGTGLRTLKQEFEKVASHNQGHLDQIKIALG